MTFEDFLQAINTSKEDDQPYGQVRNEPGFGRSTITIQFNIECSFAQKLE
mgnify:CR=1 FL=1